MKKTIKVLTSIICLMLFCALFCTLVGCGNDNNNLPSDNNSEITDNNDTDDKNKDDSDLSETRIKLSWDDKEIIIRMTDNEAARDLIAKLPLTLTWEDYINRQKSSFLDEGLITGNTTTECDCYIGTFGYYKPWECLTIFYKDYRHVSDVMPLGVVETGIEYLELLESDHVVISLVK